MEPFKRVLIILFIISLLWSPQGGILKEQKELLRAVLKEAVKQFQSYYTAMAGSLE